MKGRDTICTYNSGYITSDHTTDFVQTPWGHQKITVHLDTPEKCSRSFIRGPLDDLELTYWSDNSTMPKAKKIYELGDYTRGHIDIHEIVDNKTIQGSIDWQPAWKWDARILKMFFLTSILPAILCLLLGAVGVYFMMRS